MSVKQVSRGPMTTTYTNTWKVRVVNHATGEGESSMVLLVTVPRPGKRRGGGRQTREDILAEIQEVRDLVKKHYDFDGLLDHPDFELEVEIVEFFPKGKDGLTVAEL